MLDARAVKSLDLKTLGLVTARARIVLSLVVLLSIYVDRTTGGLFGIGSYMLITLLFHLAYGVVTYLAISRGFATVPLLWSTAALDLFFASTLALFTEGPTSPALAMFLFAIIATGCWADLRSVLTVTLASVVLYLVVIILSGPGITSPYLMRAAYLGIAGYLIDFFGQQREKFEARVHELEAEAERHRIARSLHDGYLQALAGMSLRLESCRDMLITNQPEEALAEIGEIQVGVTREYDEVRAYVLTLASTQPQAIGQTFATRKTQFQIHAAFTGAGTLIEHIVQIVLEGIRNTQRHAHAKSALINVSQVRDTICITIDDDGVGFGESAKPPWTIASYVAEFGGKLTIRSDAPGAHLEIAIPTAQT